MSQRERGGKKKNMNRQHFGRHIGRQSTQRSVPRSRVSRCKLLSTPRWAAPRREGGSGSSLTQDGGDYLATVFWALDLNIDALLQRGRGQVAGRGREDGGEGIWPSLIEQLFLAFPHSLNHWNSGQSVTYRLGTILRAVWRCSLKRTCKTNDCTYIFFNLPCQLMIFAGTTCKRHAIFLNVKWYKICVKC